MTRPAAISQADYDRAVSACQKAGVERARIRLDLAHQTIDIFLGENRDDATPKSANPWDEELADAPHQ
ncbi:hypothetical protein FHR22_002582 [Sphingopyxis panaciterrae]|uniref:hypothetical protein n=1 Tax=Sphingopyxis panaciterrae TaxID=363841 RepID=UPI00141DEE52|nr:hypothetical protein [Sphingopyxis panaciterrae]NIJ37879.1 hypothetical protein [Sphingopyxis panaciterrae]